VGICFRRPSREVSVDVDSLCSTLSPPILEIQLLHSRSPATYNRPASGCPDSSSPKVVPDLFTQGFTLDPLGPIACMPPGSLRPTTAPISTTPCLMALLPVDDLCGPIYITSLRPLCPSGRFRPPNPRVDAPTLHHCTGGCDDSGRHGHSRTMT
jgi:hypothetical protein